MVIIIEAGSPAWQEIESAVTQGRKVSLQPRDGNTVAVKIGEDMWSVGLKVTRAVVWSESCRYCSRYRRACGRTH